ncbi:hypothetical protein EV360DRAFT_70073 [Lentinula raphanica]|nr:hypothetical protein EV360DRAFT_70073 [Lentinula raphanica]
MALGLSLSCKLDDAVSVGHERSGKREVIEIKSCSENSLRVRKKFLPGNEDQKAFIHITKPLRTTEAQVLRLPAKRIIETMTVILLLFLALLSYLSLVKFKEEPEFLSSDSHELSISFKNQPTSFKTNVFAEDGYGYSVVVLKQIHWLMPDSVSISPASSHTSEGGSISMIPQTELSCKSAPRPMWSNVGS